MLILGGGGDALLPGLDWLAHRLNPRATILVVPQAWPERRFGDCLAMMRSLLWAVGVAAERVAMAANLAAAGTQLGQHGAVFLCGGNTFSLTVAMRSAGFMAALAGYRRRGGLVAGNSAGAIVLGRSIRHAHDPNDVATTDFQGCDWLDGDSIWCHYSPADHDQEIESRMTARGLPVLALPDECAVIVEPGRPLTTCAGSKPWRRFPTQGC
jgi:peptidase E